MPPAAWNHQTVGCLVGPRGPWSEPFRPNLRTAHQPGAWLPPVTLLPRDLRCQLKILTTANQYTLDCALSISVYLNLPGYLYCSSSGTIHLISLPVSPGDKRATTFAVVPVLGNQDFCDHSHQSIISASSSTSYRFVFGS